MNHRCPRCSGPALLSVQVSPGFDAVLCDACDLYHPTAGPVVMWFAVHGRLETPWDVEELASLVLPWIETVSPPEVDSTVLQATVAAWVASAYADPSTTVGGGAGAVDTAEEAPSPRGGAVDFPNADVVGDFPNADVVGGGVPGVPAGGRVPAGGPADAGVAAAGGGLICDFCEAAVPRWAYRAAEADAVPAGDWYACDGCRPYVDSREWSALAGAVGDDRSETWAAFAGAQQHNARPWPPQSRVYRWP
jgi:hypothetical protein